MLPRCKKPYVTFMTLARATLHVNLAERYQITTVNVILVQESRVKPCMNLDIVTCRIFPGTRCQRERATLTPHP